MCLTIDHASYKTLKSYEDTWIWENEYHGVCWAQVCVCSSS